MSALTQTLGSLSLAGGGRLRISWQTENAALARRIYRMLKDRMGLNPHLHFVEHSRLGGRRTCVLKLDAQEAPRLLTALRMMEPDETGKPVLRRALRLPAAYLRPSGRLVLPRLRPEPARARHGRGERGAPARVRQPDHAAHPRGGADRGSGPARPL